MTGISARQTREEIGEIVLVGRREQRLGRAADAEPGEGRQRDVRGEPPAQVGGEPRRGEDVGEGHEAGPWQAALPELSRSRYHSVALAARATPGFS